MSGRYKTLLVFWTILFLFSSAVIFINMRALQGSDWSAIAPETPDSKPEEGEPAGSSPPLWSTVLAVVTAIASGGGFIVTTIFALRNDRRESTLYQLQIENLQKEIEHKDLEIKRMRREQAPPPSAEEE